MAATHPLTGGLRDLVRWKRRAARELPTHAIELTELRDELSDSIKKWRELFGTFDRWVNHSALAHAAEQAATSDTSQFVAQFQVIADSYQEMMESESRPQAQPHLRPGVIDFLQRDARHRYAKLFFQCIQGFLSVAELANDYRAAHHWENGGRDAFLSFYNSVMSLAESVVKHRKGLLAAPPAMSPETATLVEKFVAIIEARETTATTEDEDDDEDDDDDDDECPTSAEIYTEMLAKAALVSDACQILLSLFEGLRRQVQDRLELLSAVGKPQSIDAATTASEQQEIIILVHGIRTFASWQPMVKRVLEEIPRTNVISLKYGYLDAIRFWFPILTRQAAIDELRREIQNIRALHPDARISVVAHSFGTYAISQILIENPDIKLNRLVLTGAIIPRSYRWDYVRGRLATEVINDYGTRDVWPVLAKCLSWGYGDTGRHGFGRLGVIDRGHNYTHSEFFNETFVRTYWKPWFEDGTLVRSSWDENAPPPSWFLSVLSAVPAQWILCILALALSLWLISRIV